MFQNTGSPLIYSPQFSGHLYPDSYLVSGLILHRSSCLINPEHDFVPLTDKLITAPFKCLNFLKHPSGLRIQNSCDGSLCCSSFRDRHLEHDCYICNPTTKQFVILPPPGGRIIHGVTSAYDPVRSPHYKVACVRSPGSYVSVEECPYIRFIYLRRGHGGSLVILSWHLLIHNSTGYFGMVILIGLIVIILHCISKSRRSNYERCQCLQVQHILRIGKIGGGLCILGSPESTCILLRYMALAPQCLMYTSWKEIFLLVCEASH